MAYLMCQGKPLAVGYGSTIDLYDSPVMKAVETTFKVVHGAHSHFDSQVKSKIFQYQFARS